MTDTIEIVEGDETAKTVIALDDESWDGLVRDLDTPPGLLYGGRFETVRGNPLRFVRWEPALRAMYPRSPRVRRRRSSTCTASTRPRRSRWPTCRACPTTMRDFFDTCGYVLVRDVFTPDEIAGFLEDADVLRDEAREGDKMSWWGRDANGDTVLCRVLRAATRPAFARAPRRSARPGLADARRPTPVRPSARPTPTASRCCGSDPP